MNFEDYSVAYNYEGKSKKQLQQIEKEIKNFIAFIEANYSDKHISKKKK